MPRLRLRRLALIGALAGSTALAQYRPPPLSEAQRLTYAGDDAKVEATKALTEGDKEEAVEKFKKAMDLYLKALAQNADTVAAAAGYGEASNLLGQYDNTAKILEPVYQKHQDDLSLAYPLGTALFKLKRYEQAVPVLETVSAGMKPEHLIVHYYLARYFLFAQRGEQAIAELQKYLTLRPAKLAANDWEIQQLLGQGYLLLKKPAEARTAFQTAQRGRTESLPLQLGLESVLELEHRSKDAISLLDRLVRVFPSSPEPKERLGRLLLDGGELARAEQVATALVGQAANSGPAHLLLGQVKLAESQPKAAEPELRKALSLQPALMDANVSLAKAVQLQGRNDEAIGLLEKAIQGGANTVDAWAALGSTYRRAGRFQKALEAHGKVVEMAPTVARGYELLGADHYATGQWNLAVSNYDDALEREPNDANARHWLSLTLTHRAKARASGDLGEAVRDLRRAFDLDASGTVGRSLGAALLSTQDYAKAKTVLAQSTQLPDATWKDSLLLGYALLGNHEPVEAVTAFERAATLTKDVDALAQIYSGWALSKMETGDFDTAVAKLTEEGQSNKAVAKITQANLPIALLRRALARVKDGDLDGAEKDLEAAEHMPIPRGNAELPKIRAFVRAVVDVERGKFPSAEKSLKHALAGKNRWAAPNARGLMAAYIDYRRGVMRNARRALAASLRRGTPEQKQWGVELSRAIDRREGELAYAKGNFRLAGKALRDAIKDDPLNPYVIHNLACVNYATHRYGEATAAWTKVENAVPEADLNLGIAAQEHAHEYRDAVRYYARYASRSQGGRAALARDWKERLMAIYGIPEPHVAAPTLTAPETGTEVPSDTPTLVAPTAPEAK
jgi:Flp pilus assembly protein TadD